MSEEGDFIGFSTDDPKWTTIKLENGVVLQIKLEVVSTQFSGYQEQNGVLLPIYNVLTNNQLRIQKIPKELMKKRGSVKTISESGMYK